MHVSNISNEMNIKCGFIQCIIICTSNALGTQILMLSEQKCFIDGCWKVLSVQLVSLSSSGSEFRQWIHQQRMPDCQPVVKGEDLKDSFG